MKKLYRKVLKRIENLPKFVEVKKTKTFEIISIIWKRKIYSHIKWTKEQKKQFNDFWKYNYGKKISSRWHKLYQSINGEFRVDYFPEILFTTELIPKLNEYHNSRVFADKNLLDTLFNKKIEGVRTPYTYVMSFGNMFFDENRQHISVEKVIEKLWEIGDVVIKPSLETGGGRGVRLICINNGIDTVTGQSISEILGYYKTDFVIQERIIPHEAFAKLYPNAINTIRVTTYNLGGEVKNLPIYIRLGSGGAEVDNIHAGGMGVGITDEGVCLDKSYALGGDGCKKVKIYEAHPDTGVIFNGYTIPKVSEIVSAAKTMHNLLTNINVLSWDFTVNNNDEIIIVETNYRAQSSRLPQITHKCGLFGDNTEEILKIIKK